MPVEFIGMIGVKPEGADGAKAHPTQKPEALLEAARPFLAGAAVAVLFALPLLPEVLGARRLVFRDAHVTHWPWRRIAPGPW